MSEKTMSKSTQSDVGGSFCLFFLVSNTSFCFLLEEFQHNNAAMYYFLGAGAVKKNGEPMHKFKRRLERRNATLLLLSRTQKPGPKSRMCCAGLFLICALFWQALTREITSKSELHTSPF